MTVLRAAHGAGDLIQLMREGDSPTVDPAPPTPAPKPAPPAPKPAAPAKPAQPLQAQPAKPAQAAPVETTTTTYNRTTRVTETRTASGTTTTTRPRQAPASKSQAGPPANGGVAKPHGGTAHDAAIDTEIARLRQDPAITNIRKNQQQVDVHGNKVGTNRPDIQFDMNGQHYCVEFDMNPSNGGKHGTVIQNNDPNARIQLRTP